MLFNTLEFALFFAVVYGLYLSLSHRWQNRLLLVAGYVFYGAWNWKFLGLLLMSTCVDYYCALRIHEASQQGVRRRFVMLSVSFNLGLLGFFKYFNFFAENLVHLLSLFGIHASLAHLNVILPVGISFYTFQEMSYTLDVYRGKLVPSKSLLDFAAFVSFFPQLVAGPIERAVRLLPQMTQPRVLRLDTVYDGMYLIAWGLFQKIFVADNLAALANRVFNAPPPYAGWAVLLGTYAFAFQIYCDFAGYSNIARGLSKMMGFELMVNFDFPYFARNPAEFWHRWHISLSTWLRDYLYIPLGGNRSGELQTYRNLALTMFLGGLWHGASWHFVFWGTYQGLLLIVHRLAQPGLARLFAGCGARMRALGHALAVVAFFHLVCYGWLLFRAQTAGQIAAMTTALGGVFDLSGVAALGPQWGQLAYYVLPMLAVELAQFFKGDPMLVLHRWPVAARAVFYLVCFYLVLWSGAPNAKEFIYFQF